MSAKNPDEQPVWDLCEDALDACKLIGVHLIGMQSRLELGMPVEETMKLISSDANTIDELITDLRKVVAEPGGIE